MTSSIRFGLLCTTDTDSRDAIDRYVDLCVAAEELGFVSVFLVEHHFSGWSQVSAPLMLQTCAALRTSTLRLGTGVVVLPWHNPILLAEQVATLDVLSGGRVDLGVGKGYRHNEFHGFNVQPEQASALFEESLEVLCRAWSEKTPFTHRGERWRFEDIVVEPAPVQSPHPPVWIAAASESSVRRAAAVGHHLLLDQYASPAQIAVRIEWFGRPDLAVARQVYVGYDDTELANALKDHTEFTQRTVRVSATPDRRGGSHVLRYADPEADALFGTPDAVIAGLAKVADAGADYILVNFAGNGTEQVERFARDVAPAFA